MRYGGIAQMAETDELIGAEPYFVSNVRDFATAQRFLSQVEITCMHTTNAHAHAHAHTCTHQAEPYFVSNVRDFANA